MWLDGKMIVFSGSYLLNDYANMLNQITVRHLMHADTDVIINLITNWLFLEGTIRIDDIDFYLKVIYAGTWDCLHEYDVMLAGESEFFEETHLVDSCDADDLIEYIKEFHSNPHQFAETYGN